MHEHDSKRQYSGLIAAFAAYLLWGILPAYWKTLAWASPFVIVGQRMVWSAVSLVVIVSFTKQWGEVKKALSDKKTFLILCCCGLIISVNWFLFIYAVNTGRVLDTSLGYYINPLVLVLFAFFFDSAKPRPLQWLAIGLAALGVSYQVLTYGSVPVISLGLAFTFATYGVLKKKVKAPPLAGMLTETSILVIPALIWLYFLGQSTGEPTLFFPPKQFLMLASSGLVTVIPLILFAYGAKRIALMTMGFIQYLGPTLMFIQGAFLYHEPIDMGTIVTFSMIWLALFVYSWDAIKNAKKVI